MTATEPPDTRDDDGPAAEPSPTTDGLLGAFAERLRAQFDRGSSTLRLALAESRLAASSAALLLGIAVAGAALAVIVWLLLVALAAYALWLLGASPGLALGVLLLAHLVALGAPWRCWLDASCAASASRTPDARWRASGPVRRRGGGGT